MSRRWLFGADLERRALLALLALLGCGLFTVASFAQEPISPKVGAAVAPVVDAIARAKAADAAKPPATSVRERVERLGELDQAGRYHIVEVNFGALTPEEGLEARRAIAASMEPVDRANLAELLRLLPPEGWFSAKVYGEVAANAAFHIVQHGDIATMKQLLPRLERFAQSGEIDSSDFAAMYDRVAVAEERPQRYGTQFHCVNRRLTPYPVEDPGQIEALRKAMNLPQGFAESVAMRAQTACAGG